MNQQFNITRFSLMLKLHWAENGRYYLLSFILIIGIMLLLMLPIVGTSQFSWLLYGLHILTLLGGVTLGGCFFTSTAFAAYNSSGKGIATIMVPASRLEKFLPILLISLVGTVLIFVIGLQLHHSIAAVATQRVLPGGRYNPVPPEVLQVFGHVYFILQGAIFLGSLYFTKNALVKTLGLVLILTFLAFIFNLFLAYHFTGYSGRVNTFPFIFWEVFDGKLYRLLYPPLISSLIRIFLVFIVIALISITYVRLREKEI